jgi:hypothetical protein
MQLGRDAGDRLASFVADSVGSFGGGVGNCRSLRGLVPVERYGEIELEVDVELERPPQLQGPAEQATGGWVVPGPEDAPPRDSRGPRAG